MSRVGLAEEHLRVFIAHEGSNWEPDPELEFHPTGGQLVATNVNLPMRTEFKVVVTGLNDEQEARRIFEAREEHLIPSNHFGWDTKHRRLWLLLHEFEVIRPGKWNCNNIAP
ncbi:hypothetical protein ACFL0L_05065 [Patescibacteria group bacterium]